MSKFVDIISNQVFIEFISTFGLAVLLVLYFVLIYIPKKDKVWMKKIDDEFKFMMKKYDDLTDNYNELSRHYYGIEQHLLPETRMCSKEQGTQLTNLGLDRDLYKLYYYTSEKIDGRRREDIGTFIAESIRATNEAWAKFKSPFQNVPRVSDLYDVYTNGGESLKVQLEEILNEGIPEEEKKFKIWNKLFSNTENMKREFQDCLHRLSNGKEVTRYNAKG
ncbi:MAG: hypothetical protein ACYS6K_14925 [Planctomycetota bacterium]|jgi:hypothetical protein